MKGRRVTKNIGNLIRVYDVSWPMIFVINDIISAKIQIY